MTAQPTLTYLGFDVLKLVFDRADLKKEKNSGEFKVNVKYSCDPRGENKNDFSVSFVISIIHTLYPLFNFQIECSGSFSISQEVETTTFKNFTQISAPSIVYPYIRAYVSNLFVQSGLNPLFIPTINFVNRREQAFEASGGKKQPLI